MNKITFLRTCMTTVIGKFQSNSTIEEIFNSFPLGDNVIENVNIISKYYKDSNGNIICNGENQGNLKCFPNTMTILCKFGKKLFKIRWFYSKLIHKIHIASGLKQSIAANIVIEFIKFISSNIECKEIQPIHYVLVNGLAQAKKGVNLYELAKYLNNTNLTYVFTPDTHASLKLYHELGTVSIHSSGKILYMGSKTEQDLIKLHKVIETMGNKWLGII